MNRKQKWTEEDWEQLISEALTERLEQEPPLNVSDAYQNLLTSRRPKNSRKKSHGKNRLFRRFVLIPACLFLLLIALVATPINGNAFFKLQELFQLVRGELLNLMRFQTEVDKELGETLGEEEDTKIEEYPTETPELTLQKIHNDAEFPIMLPRMEGVILKEAKSFALSNKIIEVTLTYQLTNKSSVKVVLNDIRKSASGIAIPDEETIVEDVEINGIPSILLTLSTDEKYIMWSKDDVLIRVNGKLSKEELLEFASSMR